MANLGSGARGVRREAIGHLWPGAEVTDVDLDPAAEPDLEADVRSLPIEDGYFDGIFASHLLEHFDEAEGAACLVEWYRVLKAPGKLVVLVPDLQAAAVQIMEGKGTTVAYCSSAGPIRPLDVVFGHQPSLRAGKALMAHRWGYDQASLGAALRAAGFRARVTRGPSLELCGEGMRV